MDKKHMWVRSETTLDGYLLGWLGFEATNLIRSQLMGLVEKKLGVQRLGFVKVYIVAIILSQFVAHVREYRPPLQALISVNYPVQIVLWVQCSWIDDLQKDSYFFCQKHHFKY